MHNILYYNSFHNFIIFKKKKKTNQFQPKLHPNQSPIKKV